MDIDFLYNSDLLVNSRHHRLTNGSHTTAIRGTLTESVPMDLVIDNSRSDPCKSLLTEYPELVKATYNKADLRHFIHRHIKTNGSSTNARPRRLDPRRLNIVKQEFGKLMRLGIVRPSCSPWASPIHMVQRKNGGIRLCGDHCELNKQTVAGRYSLPHIHGFTNSIKGATVFSKIDLV